MSDLEGLKPGRLRRDYLDDMTVVVVRLHTSVPLCVCACVSVCLRLCICVCVVNCMRDERSCCVYMCLCGEINRPTRKKQLQS